MTNMQDYYPQVTAVGNSGEYVVSWSGQDNTGGDFSIFVQKFNANGTITNQAPVQLEAIGNDNGYDTAPQITAVGSSGEYVVTWYSWDNAGEYSIFVQKFKADGTTTNQTPVQLEAIGMNNGYDYAPQITAVGSSGEYVVTWFGQDNAGGDYSIFVQKFSADGQVIPGITRVGNVGALTVRSSENGMAYLVNTNVNVGVLTDITNAADNLWNVVTISSAQTDTALPATGLLAGNYALYTADEAGNLSLAVRSIEVVGVATV